MKVIQIPSYEETKACVKFDYKGYEISISNADGNHRPWLCVFKGKSNSILFQEEGTCMIEAIVNAKAFIDSQAV